MSGLIGPAKDDYPPNLKAPTLGVVANAMPAKDRAYYLGYGYQGYGYPYQDGALADRRARERAWSGGRRRVKPVVAMDADGEPERQGVGARVPILRLDDRTVADKAGRSLNGNRKPPRSPGAGPVRNQDASQMDEDMIPRRRPTPTLRLTQCPFPRWSLSSPSWSPRSRCRQEWTRSRHPCRRTGTWSQTSTRGRRQRPLSRRCRTAGLSARQVGPGGDAPPAALRVRDLVAGGRP